ncbi:MAG: NAD(P)-dependent oxidoreductase [Bacteroidota bacterium]
MENKLKVIITGATGFIGKHLLEDIDLNKYIVTIITRHSNKVSSSISNKFNVQIADLRDVDSLKKAFQGQDIFINLAAEVRNLDEMEETNIGGTKNLIEAINFSNIKKVIHLSSVGVTGKSYSDKLIYVDEEVVCTPLNEYERTKSVSEMLFLEAQKTLGFSLIVLRPTNVYGEFHSFNALLKMMNHIKKWSLVAYFNSAMVNYVYVKDITSLICYFIENESRYLVLNVGQAETLERFFYHVAEELGIGLKTIALPSLIVKLGRILEINKIRTISNEVVYTDKRLLEFFNYPYGLKKGIQRTVNHYKNQDLIKQ